MRRRFPNQRKYLILHILKHFHSQAVTPYEMTLWYWNNAPDWELRGRVFAQEVFRFRRAAARLADERVYDRGGYVRKYHLARGEVGYRLTKKGERVRRKIARGSRPGYPEVARYFPGCALSPEVLAQERDADGADAGE